MTDIMLKANATVAKFLDLGQRLFSLFLANALPAVTGGAVIVCRSPNPRSSQDSWPSYKSSKSLPPHQPTAS